MAKLIPWRPRQWVAGFVLMVIALPALANPPTGMGPGIRTARPSEARLPSSSGISFGSAGISLEVVAIQRFPSKFEFAKLRVGGLSGLVFDSNENLIWAVSDDRGTFGPPRVYQLKLKPGPSPALEFSKVIILRDPREARLVLDLEGLALLPWGNFLLSSEGDDRSRPPRMPRLMDFKTSGEYVRDYQLKAEYLPVKPGQGLRTNFGFEAVAQASGKDLWLVGSEGPLAQDPVGQVRLKQYEMKEAWVLSATQEWTYQLTPEPEGLVGLTEMAPWDEGRWLTLERAFRPLSQPQFRNEIYLTSLKATERRRRKSRWA